jgi:hypothetical protein
MKTLLVISMLFTCYMGMGQAINSAAVIGNPVKIDGFPNPQIGYPFAKQTLVVAQNSFPERMNWDNARRACAQLGDGWRLPNKDELNYLYYNRSTVVIADTAYWTSLETGFPPQFAAAQRFNGPLSGQKLNINKTAILGVRAVKPFIPSNSSEIIGKPVIIGSFVVAQGAQRGERLSIDDLNAPKVPVTIGSFAVAEYDIPGRMNWDEATKACAQLGTGWRLPSRDELNHLHNNRGTAVIGGFTNAFYWTSSASDFPTKSAVSLSFFNAPGIQSGQQNPRDSKNLTWFVRAVKSL